MIATSSSVPLAEQQLQLNFLSSVAPARPPGPFEDALTQQVTQRAETGAVKTHTLLLQLLPHGAIAA